MSHTVKPHTAYCYFSVNVVSMLHYVFYLSPINCNLQLVTTILHKTIHSVALKMYYTHMTLSLISSCPSLKAPDPVHLLPSHCHSLPFPPISYPTPSFHLVQLFLFTHISTTPLPFLHPFPPHSFLPSQTDQFLPIPRNSSFQESVLLCKMWGHKCVIQHSLTQYAMCVRHRHIEHNRFPVPQRPSTSDSILIILSTRPLWF